MMKPELRAIVTQTPRQNNRASVLCRSIFTRQGLTRLVEQPASLSRVVR